MFVRLEKVLLVCTIILQVKQDPKIFNGRKMQMNQLNLLLSFQLREFSLKVSENFSKRMPVGLTV